MHVLVVVLIMAFRGGPSPIGQFIRGACRADAVSASPLGAKAIDRSLDNVRPVRLSARADIGEPMKA